MNYVGRFGFVNHFSEIGTNRFRPIIRSTTGATMRITAGLVALLAGFGLPAMAIADDEIANFEARWPEAPMRKPTLTELVHLVAGALKQDIQTALEKERFARQQTSRSCTGEICQLLSSH